MKKIIFILLILTIGLTFFGVFKENIYASQTDFPEKELQGAIMWSPGGACDTISRAVGQYVEKYLGEKIVFTNRPGAVGGISVNYIYNKPADGYNILFGADNPQTAKVMGTYLLDYGDFIPLNVYAAVVGVVLVNPNSNYTSFEDLIQDILENPDKVSMSTSGPGGFPFNISAMMKGVYGDAFNVKYISYEGEAEAVNSLLGGHVDFTVPTLASCVEMLESGKLKGLAVITDHSIDISPIEVLRDIPLVVDIYPEFDKYLPFGSFFGAYIKKGTPQEIVDKLTNAFNQAASDPDLQEKLINLGVLPMNLSGQEAVDYVENYKKIGSWLLYEAGQAQFSPEEFGIKKPE
ncbi:MAG: Bug family tripartite tricarboxylate transporter substrate binding protein [Eubacteriaceae bacterium]